MKTNNQITIWHLTDEETGVYSRQSFTVYAHKVTAVSSVNKNNTRDNKVTVRIPTNRDIKVELGDCVFFGISHSLHPERAKNFKVTEISDNRIGANPHWKLVLS